MNAWLQKSRLRFFITAMCIAVIGIFVGFVLDYWKFGHVRRASLAGLTVAMIASIVIMGMVALLHQPHPADPRQWMRRLMKMRDCTSARRMLKKFGKPAHMELRDNMEIWHYPLGRHNATDYSIYVNVIGDQVSHVYTVMVAHLQEDAT